MSASLDPTRPGAGALSARNVLLGVAAINLAAMAATDLAPGHAAWTAFLVVTAIMAWVMSRDSLKGIEVERHHRPRVFEDDRVPIRLTVRQTEGLTQTLVMVEDTFFASLSPRQRHLIPMMSRKWEAHLRYDKEAERHRGLYMIGPVYLWAADPLGIFYRTAHCETITRLTVYPKAQPLGGYRMLGAEPPAGPGMEKTDRLGQADEITGVRPYQRGDSLNRIHWRTSARRGELHTMQLDRQVQSEIALFVDLTRHARFGTGAESTTETTIACATSILTEAANLRHRISMTWVRGEVRSFPAGAGLAHLHLLLDRLAMIEFAGEGDFWDEIETRAALLGAGSRAILIATAATTPAAPATALVQRLTMAGVSVDIILLDESGLARVFRGQQPTHAEAEVKFSELAGELEHAGARVLPLRPGQTAGALLPAAGDELGN